MTEVVCGQSSWLQIERPGFDSPALPDFLSNDLEWGPLSLVGTAEELLERKGSGSGLEIRDYGRRNTAR
jgi:hypothetical protein